MHTQDMVMSLAGYAYAFRSCQNIYGTLIHCENLKIIEIMFTVQIITVKSIHYVEMVMFTAQI